MDSHDPAVPDLRAAEHHFQQAEWHMTKVIEVLMTMDRKGVAWTDVVLDRPSQAVVSGLPPAQRLLTIVKLMTTIRLAKIKTKQHQPQKEDELA